MQFWRLSAPEYDTDYRDTYINGSLEHPYGLPGIKCEVCGQTWGGTRVLHIECPEEFRDRGELQEGWPIDGPKHRALRSELAESFRKLGHDVELLPGDDFLPVFLDVPSRPTADFLWSSLGSVVVSDRVREALSSVAAQHVSFAPVNLRSAGSGDADDEPPISEDGEPEDMMDEVDLLDDTSGIGPYWEMIVVSESAMPRGIGELQVCHGCGRPSYNSAGRELVMYEDMWRGAPIFIFATTLWMVVTDDIRKMLVDMGATNVAFEPPEA